MGKTVENIFDCSIFSAFCRFFPQIGSFAIFHSFFHINNPVENSLFCRFMDFLIEISTILKFLKYTFQNPCTIWIFADFYLRLFHR